MRPRIGAPRREPLTVRGVVGLGEVARALGRRLLEDTDLGSRQGAVGEDVLVLLGAFEALPWVDGAIYLGEASPGLFVPATHDLTLEGVSDEANAARWLVEALVRRDLRGPFVFVDSRILVLRASQALEREHLERWVRG